MDNSKEVVFTYETLYEFLRREKSREELQKIEPTFFRDALTYLKEKQQAYDDNVTHNDIFSQSEREKIHIQLTNARKLLRDLYDIRERKILNMSVNHSRTRAQIIDAAHLLPPENALFQNITSTLVHHRTGILQRLLELREPDIFALDSLHPEEIQTQSTVHNTTKQVKFLEKVEQFIGEELESYGPFETNQEANLPAELANVLISQGKVVELT